MAEGTHSHSIVSFSLFVVVVAVVVARIGSYPGYIYTSRPKRGGSHVFLPNTIVISMANKSNNSKTPTLIKEINFSCIYLLSIPNLDPIFIWFNANVESLLTRSEVYGDLRHFMVKIWNSICDRRICCRYVIWIAHKFLGRGTPSRYNYFGVLFPNFISGNLVRLIIIHFFFYTNFHLVDHNAPYVFFSSL